MSIARSSLSFRVSRGKMRQLPYTYIRHANQEKDRASSIDGSVYAIRAIFFASLLVVVYHTKNPKNIVQIKQRRRDAIHTTQCASSAGVILTHVHTLPHTHTEGCDRKTDAAYIESIFTHNEVVGSTLRIPPASALPPPSGRKMCIHSRVRASLHRIQISTQHGCPPLVSTAIHGPPAAPHPPRAP